MKFVYLVTAALLISSTSAQAQTLFDSLRGLKKTVEELEGNLSKKPAPSTAHREASTNVADEANPFQGERRYDVSSFDVAGIKLGMTPDQVRSILKTNGFTFSEEKSWRSFADLAAREAKRLNQPVPSIASLQGTDKISGTDSSRNKVVISFIQQRGGSSVSNVILYFDTNTNDVRNLENDIFQRYGLPTSKWIGALGSRWCDYQRSGMCQPDVVKEAPVLKYVPQGISFWLELTDSVGLHARRDAEITALFDAPTSDRQRRLLGM
ncbi:hypothetical protein [Erythrobacter sp.]|uniref:hypothetical protein n=1 Tax=Erythrobacter sp. TaxID=1042 RepID=UPI0025E07ABA|nr:hypothetical protein [Erythrobacter sp.]